MKKLIPATVVVLILVGVGVWLTLNLSAKRKYDRMRDELSELSYSVVEIDADTTALLAKAREKWTQSHSEIGGPHSEALKTLGLRPSVSNLAHVFTYRLPQYSFFAIEQNKRSAVMGLVQGMLMPVTMDKSIHVSADGDLALIQVKTNLVQVFADEEAGLREEMYYVRTDDIEQAESRDETTGGNPLISDSIVEKAIRKSIKKPTGDLNQADLKKVTHLVLASTSVTDAGLKEVTKLPNLSSLALAFCRNVTDAGLKHVAMCEQLTTLSLVFTKVTDAGLDDVAKLSELTSLGLSNTRVTEAGVIRLQKTLPNCKIHADALKPVFNPSPIETNPLLGLWTVVEGQMDGEKHVGGIAWNFKKDGHVAIYIPGGQLIDINRYEVDQDRALLDMFKGDKKDGVVMPCLYRIEKDTLWISAHRKFGQPRPQRIGSEKGHKHMTYTLHREHSRLKRANTPEHTPGGDGLRAAPQE